MCRICSPPPGSLGNHAGRLAAYKPFTGSPGVLLITTQGRPAHLTCGVNDSVYHNTTQRFDCRVTTPSFRSKCIARNQEQQPPSLFRVAALALVSSWRFFLCRSLRRERTRMAGIRFSSYKANVSFSPFAL